MHNLEIGPMNTTFMRTVKVKEGIVSNLPPSLGIMEIYKVADYKENCPKNWDEDAYFIAMHDEEAMWMSFQCCDPVALLISAGNINCISGEKFNNKLEKDNYAVSPPQPWLDGWKSQNGTVYQFVATTAGEGLGVGEQLGESATALQISVFENKNPEVFKRRIRPMGMSFGLECCCAPVGCADEMALGKGGEITQKIYEDTYGLETWKEEPVKTTKVYLINAAQFSEITKTTMPPKPVQADQYNGNWYGLNDGVMVDVPGTTVFDNMKSIGK